MFSVTFWDFAKKPNSTARPEAEGAGFACVLKAPSGIVSPSIQLQLPANTAPTWNYAYIPDFGRYYNVSEWTYEDGLWTAALYVDVLASYKNQIEGREFYFTRSAAEYDPQLVDTYYPAKSGPKFSLAAANQLPWGDDVESGCYVVGIVGKVDPSTMPLGGITYAVMRQAEFNKLRSDLFSDDLAYVKTGDQALDAGFTQIGASAAKLMFDPFSYIRSCWWIPKDFGLVPSKKTRRWDVGFWTFTPDNDIGILEPETILHSWCTVSLPKHPQAAERGVYCNGAPYTQYLLEFPGVGVVALDPSKFVKSGIVSCRSVVDPMGGASWLDIYARDDSETVPRLQLVDRVPANFSVEISLAQSGTTLMGSATKAISGALSSVSSFISGDWAGGAANILNMPSVTQPSTTTLGSDGGIASLISELTRRPTIYALFLPLVEDDNEHHGRPLMAIRELSIMPGYNMILDGDVPLTGATAGERDELKALLEGGFYYE